jgi:hypothetical protein
MSANKSECVGGWHRGWLCARRHRHELFGTSDGSIAAAHVFRQLSIARAAIVLQRFGRARLCRPGSIRCAHRAPQIPKPGRRVSAFGDDPSRKRIRNPSPGALGPASRLRRRYAEAPADALLTGLGLAVGPASRRCRRYADTPAAASLS